MSRRLARVIVYLSAWLAPRSLRSRFREEWLAELDVAVQTPLRLASGAPIDALSAHFTIETPDDARWWPSVSDVRGALRQLIATPLLSAAAVLALAVGMTLTISSFTVVRSVFYGTLPVPDPDRLIRIREIDRIGRWGLTVDYEEYRRRQQLVRPFIDLGAYHERSITIADPGGAASFTRAAYVSSNTFALLGVSLARGRTFSLEEETTRVDPVVLISARLRDLRFAGRDPIGAALMVDGLRHQVIGIVPAPTRFPHDADIWLPLGATAGGASPSRSLTLFGRMAPDADQRQLVASLTTIAAQIPRPDAPNGTVQLVMPYARIGHDSGQYLIAWSLVSALGLIVLVSAANVSNLLLARGAARRRELAVRTALGASRSRLVMQLLLEAMVLTGLATLLGVSAAAGLTAVFADTVGKVPYWVTFGIDRTTVAFVVALAAVVSVAAGLAPALKATAGGLGAILSEHAESVRFGRLSAILIISETAVAVALLGATSILGRAMFGFNYESYRLPDERVLISQLYFGQPDALQGANAPADRERRRQIWDQFLERVGAERSRLASLLASEAGIVDVTFASVFPGNEPVDDAITIETPREIRTAVSRIAEIDDRYLEVLEARVLAGRPFTPDDLRNDTCVVLVNDAFVTRFFGDTNPLGRRLRRADETAWCAIVGVMPDLGINPGDPSQADAVYFPLRSQAVVRVGIKTAADAIGAATTLVRLTATLSPRPQVQWTQTLRDQLASPATIFRAIGAGLASLGAAALALACMGTYAIVAFSVAQRRREIAIRMALGARRRAVIAAVVGRNLRQLTGGALVGCVLSVGIREAIAVAPFAIERASLSMVGAMLGVVVLLGVAACAQPLYRALALNPASWLRN